MSVVSTGSILSQFPILTGDLLVVGQNGFLLNIVSPHPGYSQASQTSPHPAGSLYMYMRLQDMHVFSLFSPLNSYTS